MSSIANSSAEPNYLTRLALSSAPFNSVVDAKFFFSAEQIEQRLNLVSHLIRASDKVACVFADKGVGKSSLLTQIQHMAGDDLRICRIDIQPSLTIINIASLCLHAFGVDESEIAQGNNPESILKNRLLRLQKLNIRSVLLIDNVDDASPDVLSLIIDFLSWQDDDGFLLQAVLTASKVMPEWDTLHGRMQRIDLPHLAEDELSSYLMHRLRAVDYQGELPFSPKELKQFYRQSSGCPALVNQLAHQKLLGINPKLTKTTETKSQILSPLKWSGLGLLVLSLILLLVFQDTVNHFFTTPNHPSSIIGEPEVIPTDKPLATIVVGEEKVTSSEQAEREELKSLVTELNQVDKVTKLQANKSKTVESEPAIKKDSLVQKEQQKLAVIHKEEWIMEQVSTHYTFQLMGSWDKNEVAAFIDKYALAGDVAEFESMRNGRIWYALIYGVYTDKQQALKASKQWPAPLNTLPSWLRRFDSVKKQIKDREQAQ